MRARSSWPVAVWSLVLAAGLSIPFAAERFAVAEGSASPQGSASAAASASTAAPAATQPVSTPGTGPIGHAPANGAPVPRSPSVSAPARPSASAAPALDGTALPSYFTVELGSDGAVFADGAALGSVELEAAARAAAASGTFAGAVLFAEPRARAGLDEMAALLRRAGFGTLVEAGRQAPAELSTQARLQGERARARQRLVAAGVIEGESVAPAVSRAAPSGRPGPGAPAVELQTVGLYLAGPANIEPARRQLVRAFERNFPAFRRCHADAAEHSENLSFGVDLLVPTEGGKAKVRQTRTRLTGEAFQACMQRVFESIRFDPLPSGRPEIVSYSVLFRGDQR